MRIELSNRGLAIDDCRLEIGDHSNCPFLYNRQVLDAQLIVDDFFTIITESSKVTISLSNLQFRDIVISPTWDQSGLNRDIYCSLPNPSIWHKRNSDCIFLRMYKHEYSVLQYLFYHVFVRTLLIWFENSRSSAQMIITRVLCPNLKNSQINWPIVNLCSSQ